MYKKIKQNLLFIFLFFFSITVFAQNTFEINLSITDTDIIVKKLIKKKLLKTTMYAMKVNAELNVPMLQDSVILHSFKKYASSSTLLSDFSPHAYKNFSVGLVYVIEDKNNHVIAPPFPILPDTEVKNIIRGMNERLFVSPKLRIEHKLLTEQEQCDYDLAKYVIHSEKQSLELYPLLGKYHFNLPKGEYYLYFVYSNYNVQVLPPDMRVEGKLDDGNIFKGYFVSNKVKLIIE